MSRLPFRALFAVVAIIAAISLLAAAAIAAAPWIRCVHSVTVEGRLIIFETSSDGSPANPSRTHTGISFVNVAILASAAALLLLGVAMVLLMAISSLRR